MKKIRRATAILTFAVTVAFCQFIICFLFVINLSIHISIPFSNCTSGLASRSTMPSHFRRLLLSRCLTRLKHCKTQTRSNASLPFSFNDTEGMYIEDISKQTQSSLSLILIAHGILNLYHLSS